MPIYADQYSRAIVPIGVFFSLSLIFGNLVYLYLSVSFIQMLKVRSPNRPNRESCMFWTFWPMPISLGYQLRCHPDCYLGSWCRSCPPGDSRKCVRYRCRSYYCFYRRNKIQFDWVHLYVAVLIRLSRLISNYPLLNRPGLCNCFWICTPGYGSATSQLCRVQDGPSCVSLLFCSCLHGHERSRNPRLWGPQNDHGRYLGRRHW